MSKPRYTPELTKYGASTAKGLCTYCNESLTIHSRWININGVEHRVHHDCWKAILVADRLLSPNPKASVTASSPGATAVYTTDVDYDAVNFNFLDAPTDTDVDKVRSALLKTIRQRFFQNRDPL